MELMEQKDPQVLVEALEDLLDFGRIGANAHKDAIYFQNSGSMNAWMGKVKAVLEQYNKSVGGE